MPVQQSQWTEFLTCPVCCNEFSAAPRAPISLGCGHTLCRSCLASLSRRLCPFDQAPIGLEVDQLPINGAILQLLVGGTQAGRIRGNGDQPGPTPSSKTLPEIKVPGLSAEQKSLLSESLTCLEDLAVYLMKNGIHGSGSAPGLSRPMQRKLITLLNCQLAEGEGRARACRSSRSIGERTVNELILHHQNPQQLSANLWAAVRSRGCQFLGPAMQEEVLRLVLLALEDGEALSRKVLVMFIVQKLEPHFPQASKTSIGHVVQLLYRASCFKVTKREGESSLMQLKEDFRAYDALRREHDAQIVQIAMEAGLRIAPDQWSALLYGDGLHKSHMQSILDKLQTAESFCQSVNELVMALQKTGDPGKLYLLRPHFDKLAAVDPTCGSDGNYPDFETVKDLLIAVGALLSGLYAFVIEHGSTSSSFSMSSSSLLGLRRLPSAGINHLALVHREQQLHQLNNINAAPPAAVVQLQQNGISGINGSISVPILPPSHRVHSSPPLAITAGTHPVLTKANSAVHRNGFVTAGKVGNPGNYLPTTSAKPPMLGMTNMDAINRNNAVTVNNRTMTEVHQYVSQRVNPQIMMPNGVGSSWYEGQVPKDLSLTPPNVYLTDLNMGYDLKCNNVTNPVARKLSAVCDGNPQAVGMDYSNGHPSSLAVQTMRTTRSSPTALTTADSTRMMVRNGEVMTNGSDFLERPHAKLRPYNSVGNLSISPPVGTNSLPSEKSEMLDHLRNISPMDAPAFSRPPPAVVHHHPRPRASQPIGIPDLPRTTATTAKFYPSGTAVATGDVPLAVSAYVQTSYVSSTPTVATAFHDMDSILVGALPSSGARAGYQISLSESGDARSAAPADLMSMYPEAFDSKTNSPTFGMTGASSATPSAGVGYSSGMHSPPVQGLTNLISPPSGSLSNASSSSSSSSLSLLGQMDLNERGGNNLDRIDSDDEFIPFSQGPTVSRFGPISRNFLRAHLRRYGAIQVSSAIGGDIGSGTVSTDSLDASWPHSSLLDQEFKSSPDREAVKVVMSKKSQVSSPIGGNLTTVGHGMIDPPELHMRQLIPVGYRPSDPTSLMPVRDGELVPQPEGIQMELEAMGKHLQASLGYPATSPGAPFELDGEYSGKELNAVDGGRLVTANDLNLVEDQGSDKSAAEPAVYFY